MAAEQNGANSASNAHGVGTTLQDPPGLNGSTPTPPIIANVQLVTTTSTVRQEETFSLPIPPNVTKYMQKMGIPDFRIRPTVVLSQALGQIYPALLPHDHPMRPIHLAMLDLTDRTALAYGNVDLRRCEGHLPPPDRLVTPGVDTIESACHSVGILAGYALQEYVAAHAPNCKVRFTKVEEFEFRDEVEPNEPIAYYVHWRLLSRAQYGTVVAARGNQVVATGILKVSLIEPDQHPHCIKAGCGLILSPRVKKPGTSNGTSPDAPPSQSEA